MPYYLGMDAGGTTTYAIITDETGVICGVGEAGNGNHQIDRKVAEENILSATKDALITAGLDECDISYAWFGIAGGDREIDFVIIRSIIDKLQLPVYDVSGDTMIALRAGSSRPNGVVVICGTGVNCAGRNMEKEFYQCGGFGFNYGDYGGGGSLSIEVFRAVMREWDGRGEKTLLTDMVLEVLDYDSVTELFHDFLDHNRPIPNHLTKLLFPAMEQGDTIAQAILEQQGMELGLSVQAVVERLGMQNDTFDVVLAGSVVTRDGDNIIQAHIRAATKTVAKNAKVVSLHVEPVVGAILLAMEESGLEINQKIHENLSITTNKMMHRYRENIVKET